MGKLTVRAGHRGAAGVDRRNPAIGHLHAALDHLGGEHDARVAIHLFAHVCP